jgi:hypothetical protein
MIIKKIVNYCTNKTLRINYLYAVICLNFLQIYKYINKP